MPNRFYKEVIMKYLVLGLSLSFILNASAMDCAKGDNKEQVMRENPKFAAIVKNASEEGKYQGFYAGQRVRIKGNNQVYTLFGFSATGVYGKKMGIVIKSNLYEIKKFCVSALLGQGSLVPGAGGMDITHTAVIDDIELAK